jgi:hypothetical protein
VRLDDVDGRDKPGHDAGAADVASPVSSKGTGRRPVRTRNDRELAQLFRGVALMAHIGGPG